MNQPIFFFLRTQFITRIHQTKTYRTKTLYRTSNTQKRPKKDRKSKNQKSTRVKKNKLRSVSKILLYVNCLQTRYHDPFRRKNIIEKIANSQGRDYVHVRPHNPNLTNKKALVVSSFEIIARFLVYFKLPPTLPDIILLF